MPPPVVDRNVVEQLVARAVATLEGDWLLVGGGLALLWLDSPRATRDIDLVALRGAQADRLALMDLAADLGLPIETVNAAADYFVRRIEGWEQMLQPLRGGPRARILRPDPTLFVLLKLRRLAESDLDDCLLLLRRAAERGWSIDTERIRREAAALPPSADADLAARRAALLQALGEVG
jgi:hypothetical protein